MIALQPLLLLARVAFTFATNTPDDNAAEFAQVYRDVQTKVEELRLGYCAICTSLCRMDKATPLAPVFDEIDRLIDDDPGASSITQLLIGITDYSETERENFNNEIEKHLENLVRNYQLS